MSTHIIIGLSAAFIFLAFYSEHLAVNDRFSQIAISALIGAIIGVTTWAFEYSYNSHLDRIAKERTAFIQEIQKAEELKYYNQIKSGRPLRLMNTGFDCRKYR